MSPDEIINTITERIRDTAHVRVVFGDVVQIGEVSIIPVASVKIAGGGGMGKGSMGAAEAGETGRGAGIGVKVTAMPMGYIEVKEGKARLVPIVDTTKVAIGGMIVSGLLAMSLMRFIKLMTLRKKYKLGKMKMQQMKAKMHEQHAMA